MRYFQIEREIQCPIYGPIAFTAKEINILNHKYLQRLRYISQLGFASFVFPGATHTRFSHSLGVIYLVSKKWKHICLATSKLLNSQYEEEQQEYFYSILRLAALVHDAGHAPFSHAAESLFPTVKALKLPDYIPITQDRKAQHEDYTFMIVQQLAVDGFITKQEARDIITLLHREVTPSERFNSKQGKPSILLLLRQLINGEVDADRMDYLRRDAYYTGVPYGVFDVERLLRSFTCYYDEEQSIFRITIHEHDVAVYENFLLARMHMFRKVYFHSLLGSFIYFLKQAVEEKEIDITPSFLTKLDNFTTLTEPFMYELFRQKADKKWLGKIWKRETASLLLNYDMATGEKDIASIKQDMDYLKKEGIECFLHESKNSYTKQKVDIIDDNTIMVSCNFPGEKKYLPLASVSPLLQNEKMKIHLYHVYVFSKERRTKAEKLLHKRYK